MIIRELKMISIKCTKIEKTAMMPLGKSRLKKLKEIMKVINHR
jgi:hypothetical protein